jgi:hypothetical protein
MDSLARNGPPCAVLQSAAACATRSTVNPHITSEKQTRKLSGNIWGAQDVPGLLRLSSAAARRQSCVHRVSLAPGGGNQAAGRGIASGT